MTNTTGIYKLPLLGNGKELYTPLDNADLSGATSAAAVDALDDPALLQLRLRHPADAVRREIRVSGLNKSMNR